MSKITNWSAVRSGALMTVSGTGSDGKPVKLTKVELIRGGPEGTVAHRGDERFALA